MTWASAAKQGRDPNLVWAAKVNDERGIGLFGPTLKRVGPVPECEDHVKAGRLRAVRVGTADEMGYWITDAGREALRYQATET